jgi:curved DNA-binding protein CbpA
MPERAQVTSVEAIESFRACLIVYLTKARALLEEVSDEKQRTRAWLQDEQRVHWEQECRLRRRKLEDAEQELFSAKLSRIQTQSAAQILAVERCKRSLREVEEKLAAVRKWNREFENRAEPLVKQIEQLQTFLTTDLSKAVAYLGTVLTTLEAYLSIGTPPTSPPSSAMPTVASESGDASDKSARIEPGAKEGGAA